MDVSQIFNSIEMFFWLIVSAIFFASGLYKHNRYEKLLFLLSVALVAFGVSDGVEVNTGAWWLPVWKISCVIILAGCLIYYHGISAV